jgi:sugar lactone lactonase YvrE
MRRIAIAALACALSACNNRPANSSRAANDRPTDPSDRAHTAAAANAAAHPTTNPSATQIATMDPAQLRSANLPVAAGGPATGKRDDKLKPYAIFTGPCFPTGLTVSHNGRLFVCYPRWGQPVNFTVGEVTREGLVPFPDAPINGFHPSEPTKLDPRTHLVSVQSVVFDSDDRLWLLDTGSINMQPWIDGGPKMWAYDLHNGQRVKEITFGDALKKQTYLNDVRFDLKRGDQGTAYITDSGAGGIIVVDLASGKAWRKLDGHPSVMADKSLTLMVEGQPLKRRPPTGEEKPVLINSDGIALSPDGKTLYYTPLTGHAIYAVATDFLADRNASSDKAETAVRKLAEKPSANDGLICDAQGRIYTSDFEDNSIRRFTPSSAEGSGAANEARTASANTAQQQSAQVIVQDERLLWPDTFCIQDGNLYVTANQLNRQPDFHRGENKLQQPFTIFQIPIDGQRNPNE